MWKLKTSGAEIPLHQCAVYPTHSRVVSPLDFTLILSPRKPGFGLHQLGVKVI